MKPSILKPSTALLPLFIASYLLGSSCFAQSEVDYEQELNKLSATIEQLQQQLTRTKSSRDKLQQSLQHSEEEIGTLTKQVDRIKEALSREKKQLSQLQRRRAELEQSRQQQQQQINQIVRQAYILGRKSHIKLLLNQEEPYRLSRLLRYHDYIVSAHKAKLDAYLTTLQDIDSTENNIAISSENLKQEQSKLNQRFRKLKSSQAKRLKTLTAINNDLKTKGNSINQLQVDRKQLEKLLAKATLALSKLKLPNDAQAFRKTRGKLPYPTKGRLTHSYGSSRIKDKLRWQGLFFSGKTGSAVNAIHYGRVIFSDYLRGQGLLIIIDHGDGYMSLYAHNQTLLKDTGDWVKAGEKIATMGNTGGQTQAGLYFEIRHHGKPQNPKPWLRKG